MVKAQKKKSDKNVYGSGKCDYSAEIAKGSPFAEKVYHRALKKGRGKIENKISYSTQPHAFFRVG